MKPIRMILAFIGGLVAAAAVVVLVESVAHATLEGPAVFAATALGYGLAALAGSAMAAALSGRAAAVAVVLVLAVLAAVNLFSFAHPAWFAPVAVATLGAGLWLGLRLAPRLKRTPAP